MTSAPPEPRLRLNAGGLFAVVPELRGHHPADPTRTLGRLLGPPREVADGVVIVTRYADCYALMRDPRIRRSRRLGTGFEGQGTSFLIGLDPPEHTRTRRLLGAAFTPRVIDRMRTSLEVMVHELLDAVVGRDHIDLAEALSRPMPLGALGVLIGIPPTDWERVSTWSDSVAFGSDILAPSRTRDQQRAYREALGAFRAYLRPLLAARRAEPADDLISRLTQDADGGDQLSDREIIANVMGLLVAGNEATVSAIGHGLLAALREPRWWKHLASDGDDFAGRFTDETLRLDSPIQANPRVAGEDLVIDGVDVRKGSSLILLLGIANRDPAAFPDPHRFDPNRQAGVRHLALGTGTHYCIGAGLGRLETMIVLQAAAHRLIAPRLIAGGVSYAPGWGIRVPHRIEVEVERVRPRKAVVGQVVL